MNCPSHPIKTTLLCFRWVALLMGVIVGTILPKVPSQAQLQPDNSLGTESSIVSLDNIINGGATRGSNLFHSFSDFNVNAGQSVYFANPVGIDNILSRVTGNNVSNIDGLLGVNGTANLFLLNPNGIIFGENAALDISGSFTASTANSFQFTDGSEFQATPLAGELLSMSVPLGVQFNDQPQGILTDKAGILVGSGSTLTLLGKKEESNKDTLLIRAEDLIIENTSTSNPTVPIISALTIEEQLFSYAVILQAINTLTINSSVQGFRDNDLVLEASNIEINNELGQNNGGDIRLITPQIEGNAISINGALVSTANGDETISGGNIGVITHDFTIQDDARLMVQTISDNGKGGGGIFIDASGDLSVQTFSSIQSAALFGGAKSGVIDITADNLVVTDSSSISTSVDTFNNLGGFGNSGDINIVAVNNLEVSDGSEILSQVSDGATGNGGFISITTPQLTVSEASFISTSTLGTGNAGNMLLNVFGDVFVTEGGAIESQVANSAMGNGGRIDLIASSLNVIAGQINAATEGIGDAGNIVINTSGDVTISEFSGLNSQAAFGSTGDGGTIEINARNLKIADESFLAASSLSDGDAGDISINVAEDVSVTGFFSAIESQVAFENSLGDGGTIDINARNLEVADQAFLSVSSFGEGNAGNIIIDVSETVSVTGEFTFIESLVSGNGDGGSIEITTTELILSDGSLISASTSGSGDAGNLTILGRSPLTLRGDGKLTVESLEATSGSAGTLTIGNASDLAIRDGIVLSAESASENGGGEIIIDIDNHLFFTGGSLINAGSTNPNSGDGGNITIRLGNGFVITPPGQDNDIIANAVAGERGNIDITALQIFGFTEQEESRTELLRGNGSSDLGASGVITLSTLDLDPSQGLVELPAVLSDRTDQIAAGCDLNHSEDQSEFVVTGRGGLPLNSSTLGNAAGVSVPWVIASDDESLALVGQQSSSASPTLVEAQKVAIDTMGNLSFVVPQDSIAHSEIQASTSDFCQVNHQL
ncbi:filamentous hemagglutinin family outer membrane protein [[Leptolyngbya] sp. PCC 7376]|uniref:two-partner secretion domain-containing protein n=1 Tax=[Leptolyngbya] sp. PCC 7376 TaxID=111781 RepID=UPI00029F42AA|nr:filamentous hemagglutinin N-terminal domain-containing protein [[Leptolyngbya] sp. PCC 7376]AFY38532.1 filamentous hemagglutinin family outer membrane protein [[Leptolyngbya] sp. PCC 7376]